LSYFRSWWRRIDRTTPGEQAQTPHGNLDGTTPRRQRKRTAGGLLEIQSQARRYVKIAVLSCRRRRGRRPETPALQARELSAETKETMSVIYAKGETMI
jgi:hypothetical protein